MVVDTVPLAAAGVVGLLALLAVVAVVDSIGRFLHRLAMAPGVVVHEFAHAQACRLVGVSVVEVVYFRFGDPPGYVRHAHPGRYRESFVISVAPFLVNSVVSLAAFFGVAVLAASAGFVDAVVLGDVLATASALWDALGTAPREVLAAMTALAWLGFVVGIQAFPSTGDANTLWSRSRAEWRRSPVVLLGVPVVAVIYVANLLSWLWADVLYTLGLAALAFVSVGVVSAFGVAGAVSAFGALGEVAAVGVVSVVGRCRC